MHDAEVIRLHPLAIEEDAVAEGEESLPLPSQLRDYLRRFRLAIEISFEFRQLLLRRFPDEVAQSFDLQLELLQ